jgi:MoaA/NifB/PqqE/SkfB family radical SAM enzyme
MPAWMHEQLVLTAAPCDGVPPLAKVYIEPTSRCNLACRTCMRNAWGEPLGDMSEATFAQIIASLRALDPRPTVFLGGIGEPLFHPRIVEMVAQAKAVSAAVELITNGTLLDEDRARALIAAGLDRLWVSLDGATPESYTDVRLGAALSPVIANIARLRELAAQNAKTIQRGESFREKEKEADGPRPEIGIAFVAMRRNLADLPALLRLAKDLGAARFMVTNVLPYTPAMCAEVLYARALSNNHYAPVPNLPDVSLPKMDRDPAITAVIQQGVYGEWQAVPDGHGDKVMTNRCPFIDGGVLAVGWDGGVSPCLPLLHNVTSYLHGCERLARRYVIGSVNTHSLSELWADREHRAFRERVHDFDFSPCAYCDGCLLSEMNEEDCFGNDFPTCGGCLWAQGIVQCP